MDNDAQQGIERFLVKLHTERRLSPHTLKSYRRDLDNLSRYCDQHQVNHWRDLTEIEVRQYVGQRHRQGIDGKSLQRELSAFRSCFNYLLSEGEISSNPATHVKAPRSARKLPDTLDVDMVKRLVEIQGDAPLTRRDRAILELFYSSGLRLSELVGLELNSVDLTDATVEVTGKGNKTRRVPLGRHAVSALQDWLQCRSHMVAGGDETAIFVSRQGRRLSPRSVQARLRHWAVKQGIDMRVYPHLLRHSFASHMLESSQDLRAVQELLGHANISTTQIYTHLDFQHLASVYDKAHPRARKKDD
ncbi:MAG: tyrosine recombinase XerC [Proteobacteria bacterium]|nr:tyrosine recombinase XerC [Pseudomonadota bacterium]MCG6936016.1 tyrosine recombinase XerC [Pseudomonadota bacterium]